MKDSAPNLNAVKTQTLLGTMLSELRSIWVSPVLDTVPLLPLALAVWLSELGPLSAG